MATKTDKTMGEDEIKRLLVREISAAESEDDTDLSALRTQALEYFDGVMDDLQAEQGRSSVVSKDVADTIGWMLPGIVKMFTASEFMAVAEAVGQEDEEWAKQATMGLNHCFWKENSGYRVLRDATFDALLLKNAIIKVYHDDTPEYEITFHSGLTDDELAELIDGEDVEVLQHSMAMERLWTVAPGGDPNLPAQAIEIDAAVHEVKIKRLKSAGREVIECIPPEDYLQDAEAVFTAQARFKAHRARKTRSDLIEMGFDEDVVAGLSISLDDKTEKTARDDDADDGDSVADRSMQEIDLYECYLRVDIDGDGIAETIRAYYAGSKSGGELLDWEVWEDEGPFFDIPCDPIPHRWDGKSVADDTMDIQKNKTALLRQFMDNVYASNNPQRFVTGKIINPEQLFSPTFGGAIFGEDGATVVNISVPMVAGQALEALAYQDEIGQRRTGVSRQSMALDPEALQNQSATANQNNKDASQSQVELIARDMAELGWTPVFRCLLKLIIKHQNKARVIRMQGKSVQIDPKSWNADMDVTIDVGLGTGSRDRDMMMLQGILGNQVSLIDRFTANGFPEKALEMVPKVLTTLTKLTESAGIRNPEAFFPTISPEEMKAAEARIAQMQQQGDPKLEAEQAKQKADQEFSMAKFQAEIQLKRDQLAAEMTLKREQMQAEMQLKREMHQQEMQMRALSNWSAPRPPESPTVASSIRLGGELG